jgi:ABC-2 type transport system permease protein
MSVTTTTPSPAPALDTGTVPPSATFHDVTARRDITAGLLTSTMVVAGRTLRAFVRSPQLLVVGTIQGAIFLLIFRYVFGGAIGGHNGIDYVDFLVPGFVVTGVLFSGMSAAAGVAEDSQRGVLDRLRSLPIPRLSLPGGRAVADTALVGWGVVVTLAVGVAVGFRPGGTLADSLIACGLTVLFGFAFCWLFILIGLVSGSAQAAQGMSMIVFPLTFVSSAYVAVETLPGWMQTFARNQPITAMIDAVRAWFVEDPVSSLGHTPGYFTVKALLWTAGLVAVFAPLATAMYARRT